jgi:hypothetical protein
VAERNGRRCSLAACPRGTAGEPSEIVGTGSTTAQGPGRRARTARQGPAYEGPPRRRSSSRLASAESAFAYLSGAAIRPVTSTRTGPAHQRVSRPRVPAFLAHAQLLTAASTKRDGQRDHVNDPLGRPQLATCCCQQGHRGHPGSMPAAGPPERPCLPWPETERLSRSSDAESLVAPARPVRHLPGRAGLPRGQGAADCPQAARSMICLTLRRSMLSSRATARWLCPASCPITRQVTGRTACTAGR